MTSRVDVCVALGLSTQVTSKLHIFLRPRFRRSRTRFILYLCGGTGNSCVRVLNGTYIHMHKGEHCPVNKLSRVAVTYNVYGDCAKEGRPRSLTKIKSLISGGIPFLMSRHSKRNPARRTMKWPRTYCRTQDWRTKRSDTKNWEETMKIQFEGECINYENPARRTLKRLSRFSSKDLEHIVEIRIERP